MSIQGRAAAYVLIFVAILAVTSCGRREAAVDGPQPLRDPMRAPSPSVEAVLAEARRDFTCCGKAIHPALIFEFLPWISDSGPVTVAIDLLPAQDADRYYLATVKQRAGWTECSVKSLLPHCWDNEPTINAPEFGYQRVGVLADSTQVLRTYYCMGGSGIFMNLVFVRFEIEPAFDGSMKPFRRVVMKAICVYPLGDRDEAELRVFPDRVIVGPSKHRDKEVVLRLN